MTADGVPPDGLVTDAIFPPSHFRVLQDSSFAKRAQAVSRVLKSNGRQPASVAVDHIEETLSRVKPMEELIKLFMEPHRDMLPPSPGSYHDEAPEGAASLDKGDEGWEGEGQEPPQHPQLFVCLLSSTQSFLHNSSKFLSACHRSCMTPLGAAAGEGSAPAAASTDAKRDLIPLMTCISNCTYHILKKEMIPHLQDCLAKGSVHQLCTLTGCLIFLLLWVIRGTLMALSTLLRPSVGLTAGTRREPSPSPPTAERSPTAQGDPKGPTMMSAEHDPSVDYDTRNCLPATTAATGPSRHPSVTSPAMMVSEDTTSAHPLSPLSHEQVNVVDVLSESPPPVDGDDDEQKEVPPTEPGSPTPSSGAAAAAVLHHMAVAASSFMTGLTQSPARATASRQLLDEGDEDEDDGALSSPNTCSPFSSEKAMSSDSWEEAERA